MNVGGTLVAALAATLASPSTWVLALAGFLVRGGLLLVLFPIVLFPTPVGVADLIGPTLVAFVFGGVSTGFLVLVAIGVLAVVAWIVVGGLVAAAVEAEGIRAVAADEDVAGDAVPLVSPPTGRHRRSALRILAVRILLLIPLLATLGWGATRVVAAAYRELTNPGDVAVPIVLRVLQAVPEVVAAVVVAWLVGEVLGGLAARHLVLDDVSIARAFGRAVGDVIRRPLRTLVLFAVPAAALIAVLVPSAAAAGVAWTALRSALQQSDQPFLIASALVAFSALWLGGLALASVICAWRQAAWTVDLVRRRSGTFGGRATTHPGDWNREASSVTL